jgi:uncharacterized protein (TIGR02246 family)
MRTLIGGAVALMVLASPSLVARAGQTARPTQSLEARLRVLEDKEAIHAVMTNYGRTLDGRDFAGFERLWARDAEFLGGPGGRAIGPVAIRALLEGLLKANAAAVPGKDFHLFYNETIEVSGDRATALSKGAFVVPGPNNRLEMSILANYHDEFVREDGRWKFRRRQIGEAPPPATAAK